MKATRPATLAREADRTEIAAIARSTWLTTPFGTPYRLPDASVVLEIYRRPLTGGWWMRMLDRGGMPLRVDVDCTRGDFLVAIKHHPGEYHLLPIDAASGQPATVRAPGWVRVDVGRAATPRSIEATPRAWGPL